MKIKMYYYYHYTPHTIESFWSQSTTNFPNRKFGEIKLRKKHQ